MSGMCPVLMLRRRTEKSIGHRALSFWKDGGDISRYSCGFETQISSRLYSEGS
jgi:hypothetical protein